jgi:hypothetical protein
LAVGEIEMTSNTLSLHHSVWTGALNAGVALCRLGLATRRFAKAKLLAAQRASARDDGRLDPAADAAEVRALAATYAQTDRGFADDLYAAAARHERAHGA